MAKQINYMWPDKLDLKKLPKTIRCRTCDQPMHLIPMNENIVFWIHKGKELEKCTEISFKTSFAKYFYGLVNQKIKTLEEQIPKCQNEK